MQQLIARNERQNAAWLAGTRHVQMHDLVFELGANQYARDRGADGRGEASVLWIADTTWPDEGFHVRARSKGRGTFCFTLLHSFGLLRIFSAP